MRAGVTTSAKDEIFVLGGHSNSLTERPLETAKLYDHRKGKLQQLDMLSRRWWIDQPINPCLTFAHAQPSRGLSPLARLLCTPRPVACCSRRCRCCCCAAPAQHAQRAPYRLPLPSCCRYPGAVTLSDGRVVVVGGVSKTAQAEYGSNKCVAAVMGSSGSSKNGSSKDGAAAAPPAPPAAAAAAAAAAVEAAGGGERHKGEQTVAEKGIRVGRWSAGPHVRGPACKRRWSLACIIHSLCLCLNPARLRSPSCRGYNNPTIFDPNTRYVVLHSVCGGKAGTACNLNAVWVPGSATTAAQQRGRLS